MTTISERYRLPCGVSLKNRLAKAAMSEWLADSDLLPNERHITLYKRWAQGGVGLIITGNVIVDRKHLENPANVAIDKKPGTSSLQWLRAYAKAAQENGARALVQLSHGGRQTPKLVNPNPLAPSAVKLDIAGDQFGEPRSITSAQIDDVIGRFVQAAHVCSEAGFAGVQIHSAHGYLLSSFLNPLANQRSDRFGGRLENRARPLLQICERIRAELPEDFILSVKLNSADFQKGGLTHQDSLQIAEWLEDRGVDLLEISGGSYEQPAMMDIEGQEKRYEEGKADSTRKREAYFLEFAEELRTRSTIPLMVTGGFRTLSGMNAALADQACDLIGMARPLCIRPNLPNELLDGSAEAVKSYEKHLQIGGGVFGPQSPIKLIRAVNGVAAMAFFSENIDRMASGLEPSDDIGIFGAFLKQQRRAAKRARALR